ncbi:hypothetical protein AOQ84DRAFT_338402 [Glonium stellatum]|uniref:Uncharacterized protein n=1 Tax=Glonium stellatum TaxID=574774 RepID=A0A8E2F471_9PEZI|nr:hypothetical protein AOQ84DRAFT_338402 [Glonium stellatum]
MIPTEQILHDAAKDGSIDSNEWPRVLKTVLSRLDQIVHNDFPKPTILVPEPPPPPPLAAIHARSQETSISSQESQSADKENAPPATSPSRPPVPPFSRASSTQVDGTPSSEEEPQSLPADVISFYTSICNTLSKNFSHKPPHTIQRLAELILNPKSHYKHLPPFLRALDRVVSVSSPTTIFPLPQAVLPSSISSGLLNGTAPAAPSTLGSDESLGGALLTPIPWLRTDRGPSQSELVSESTEMVDGPHGAGRIETVSVINGITTPPASPSSTTTASSATLAPDANSSTSASPSTNDSSLRDAGAITQGELLRQEQEAGVIPLSQNSPQARRNMHISADTSSNGQVIESVEGEEEHPHARGPEEIGMEDMGPQSHRSERQGLDIEAAVGRPAVRHEEHGRPGDQKTEDQMDIEATTDETENSASDIIAVDGEGKIEQETKTGESDGEMSDVVDMSTG